jgi:shikimate kinase
VNRDRLADRIYLVGFMGAGKTTVGRELALLLGYQFLDIDAEVEKVEGRTVEELFRDRGEGYFREKEWEILASTALRHEVVVATGGGLFLAPMHRNFIRRHGTAVWLDISVDEAWSRCATAGGRPLFTTPDELTALLEARRSRYELAEHRIDVNQRSISEIAHEIAERLAGGETPESSDDEAQA